MPTQLMLDFRPRPIQIPTWLDVSQVGRGVGFPANVQVSPALYEALTPLSTEEDGDDDQRLYDALWLAHFELTLDHRNAANFTFSFPRKHWKTEVITDVSLRLRSEMRHNSVFLGLLQDFQEATWRTTSADAPRAI